MRPAAGIGCFSPKPSSATTWCSIAAAALDKLEERLLDAHRAIGQPDKIAAIFGRKGAKRYRGKIQREIENMPLAQPGDPQP